MFRRRKPTLRSNSTDARRSEGVIADAMDIERLSHLRCNRQAAIERAKRVLKNHLHTGTLTARHSGVSTAGSRLPLKMTLPASGLFEPEHQPACGGFPETELADETERFAARIVESEHRRQREPRGLAEHPDRIR